LPDGSWPVQRREQYFLALGHLVGRGSFAGLQDLFRGERRWAMTNMLNEFKEFALRGNVVDMAVGIIIGGAFGTIVQSLVKDVIMPPIGSCWGASISRTSKSRSGQPRPARRR
jgi:hypothetical protein